MVMVLVIFAMVLTSSLGRLTEHADFAQFTFHVTMCRGSTPFSGVTSNFHVVFARCLSEDAA
jgi:hypothetical protein